MKKKYIFGVLLSYHSITEFLYHYFPIAVLFYVALKCTIVEQEISTFDGFLIVSSIIIGWWFVMENIREERVLKANADEDRPE